MQEPHARLDRAMDERRVELRMSWRDVAQAAGISEAALRTIRRGRHVPTDLTAARIEDALQWQPRTVRSILSGDGEPAPMTLAEIADKRAQLLAALAELDALEQGRNMG